MKGNRLLGTGIVGTIVSALCCFTPVLVIMLGGLGLSAWLGWLDYFLLPALVGFASLTVYAVYVRRRESNE
jgi:mercuric ion transport protein